MKSPILCGLVIIGSTLAQSRAADTSIYIYTTESNRVTITGLATNASGAVVIPATLGNYTVSAIGRGAFLDRTNLTSITFASGASVTNIGASAFQGCTSLATVELPMGLTSISAGLFYNCTGLLSVSIPTGVTKIDNLAFAGCRSLPSLALPAGLTALGESAFLNCRSLTSLDLPDGITAIAGQLCCECRALTSIRFPSGLTHIGYAAFDNCLSLAELTLPASVTMIANDAFHGCSGLTSLTLNGALTSVGDRAFYGCTSLNTLEFNGGVISLGEAVFGNCPALAGVYFVGDAPALGADNGADMFVPIGDVTVCYLASSSGWGANFCGATAETWNPQISEVGATTDGFQVTVRWANGQTVRMQVCSDLGGGTWTDLGTNTIASGSCLFNDPDWTTHNQRFYRVRTASE